MEWHVGRVGDERDGRLDGLVVQWWRAKADGTVCCCWDSAARRSSSAEETGMDMG